ncbi:MAG: glycogen debranching protein GlgX [Suipraeoptans sp.]
MEEHQSHWNLKPTDKIDKYDVRPGFYNTMGATAIPGGVSFTIASSGATSCELLLYKREEKVPYAILPFPENYRVGDVFAMIVFDIDVKDLEYAYRMDGPYDEKNGLLFDKKNVLLDPYAKAVAGQREWGVHLKKDGYKARVVMNNFMWGQERHSLATPLNDLIIYELHVRGFTQGYKEMKERGTFAGLKAKIPYLKELGVNAVELMPIFEFDELSDRRIYNGKELLNYWGYNSVCFYAPNTSYAYEAEYNREGAELKKLIRALHENGIEVILDVVFNHTAEGNENGPVISFKGIDNNVYYMLTPDGYYYNFSGTGNTVNCNHPVVRRMITDCLRHWVTLYHIDGFRFDLASILGRDESGAPLSNPPLIEQLAFDPVLSKTKLIAEAWDAGGLYQVGSFPGYKKWAEWNGRYRDDLRSFLKGDMEFANAAANRIAGSFDIYGETTSSKCPSVNFLTCHDGFTLYDLYSYNDKHNEANGWNNTDGNNDNRSWNCGVEGDTTDEKIINLRKKMVKNAAGVLFCSKGAPMFLAGDEFLNSQFGNNNAYCQDNEISWLNWEDKEENADIFEYFKYMIDFRKKHPAIRGMTSDSELGLPPITFYNESGIQKEAYGSSPIIGVMFAGCDKNNNKEDIVFILINVYWEAKEIVLPTLPRGFSLYKCVDTGNEELNYLREPEIVLSEKCKIQDRSIMIFIGGRS